MRIERWLPLFVVLSTACAEEDRRVPMIPEQAIPDEPAAAAPIAEPEAAPAPVEPQVRTVARRELRTVARPEPRPEPRPVVRRAEPPRVAAPGIEIVRAEVAREIVAREPSGDRIAASDERAYLFLEVANPGTDTELAVVWIEPGGTEGAPIALSVPSARRWRTWATTRRTHARAGEWTVVVRDASGRVLARRTFRVAPGEIAAAEVSEPTGA